jgi:flagellar biosynthesis GTPase FlhF
MDDAAFIALKKKRTTLRQQVTRGTTSLTAIVNSSGSRRNAKALIVHLNDLILRTSVLQTEITAIEEDEDEAERQDSTHLTYVGKCDEAIAAARAYLTSREGEEASVVNLHDGLPVPNPPLIPITPSEAGRRNQAQQEATQREQAHKEEVAAAERKCEEIRMRAQALWEEAEAAQAALNQLNIRQPDQDHYSSVSQQLEKRSPAAEEWLNKQRNLNDNQDAPDDWIDLYNNGRLLPVHSKFSSRSAVSAELDVYTGKAIEWFGWIDLFRALVHDTPKTPGEKLALLKHYLKGECLDVVYGLGGGESAYKQALVRLKETFGRRDVMRAAHIQAIERLEFKNEPRVFKRFAERVRTHLFDLSRIGEASSADIIEKICFRLNQQDRLDWNAGRRGRLEFRSLNDFGTWICERASDYLNAYSIAADQVDADGPATSRGNFPRRANTHYSSVDTSEGAGAVSTKKPFCYKCEKEHWLQECESFKALSVEERINFCILHRLCFSCFSCRHPVQDFRTKRRCRQPECRYFHHFLLHEARCRQRKKPVLQSLGLLAIREWHWGC